MRGWAAFLPAPVLLRSLTARWSCGQEAYIQRIAALPAVSDYIRTKQEPTTWFAYRFPHIVGPLGHRLTTPEELEGLTDLAPKL